jgi:hypothetical protein
MKKTRQTSREITKENGLDWITNESFAAGRKVRARNVAFPPPPTTTTFFFFFLVFFFLSLSLSKFIQNDCNYYSLFNIYFFVLCGFDIPE